MAIVGVEEEGKFDVVLFAEVQCSEAYPMDTRTPVYYPLSLYLSSLYISSLYLLVCFVLVCIFPVCIFLGRLSYSAVSHSAFGNTAISGPSPGRCRLVWKY